MKTVLVTGGAGFIGSSLIDKIIEIGNAVVTIDNFNDYYDSKVKERNISEIRANIRRLNIKQNRLILYRKDIRDKESLDLIFNKHKIDIVVHLAAMAGVRYSIDNPRLYYDVNITGTLNLLELANKNDVKRFIFGSSSSVYGNNPEIQFNEDDIVDYPISPYAASKKAGELLCHTYYYLNNMSIACLRFFTVYGPRQRPDLAIHKFVKLILENKPIPFFGDGRTERDYTYIEDIVNGIIRAIEWTERNEKKYEIFNLGNSKTVSLKELVKTIEEVLGKKAIIEELPMQPGDVKRTNANITKAKTELNYLPDKDFKEGIKDFVEWLENY